jgi:formate/nitrite transporter FocA (FNT family)
MLVWMRKHKFEAHSIAFLLMILPPILLYLAAQDGAVTWIIVLLIPVVLGNILELFLE